MIVNVKRVEFVGTSDRILNFVAPFFLQNNFNYTGCFVHRTNKTWFLRSILSINNFLPRYLKVNINHWSWLWMRHYLLRHWFSTKSPNGCYFEIWAIFNIFNNNRFFVLLCFFFIFMRRLLWEGWLSSRQFLFLMRRL